MRVAVSTALRVRPGDEVFVRGELVPTATLGRLYVFARELPEQRFSPYVKSLRSMVVGDRPSMHSPVSMRLVREMPARELSFVSDIDGYVCVAQEVDTADDPRAKVKMKRVISSNIDWKEWFRRKFGVSLWPIKIIL